MNRTLPALALAAALGLPAFAHAQAPAAPPSLVDEFKALCVATAADKTAALAAADASGWGPIPEALMAQAAGVMQEATGRLKVDAGGFEVLILGEQAQAMAGMTLRIKACAVIASPPDPAAVEAAAGALAGVAKAPIPGLGDGASLWAFNDTAAGHVLLNPDDKAGVQAAVTAGTARLVFFRPLATPGAPPGLTLLGYGVPRT